MKDMYGWIADMIAAPVKKALPVLSFPCASLMGVTVDALTHSEEMQAEGMRLVARRCDAAAAVSFMDLSVEAEAFGAEIRCFDNEVPTVIGNLIDDSEEVYALERPNIGAGRTGMYVNAVSRAAREITDRPVLAGCIGPFSLAGRLMGMTEVMVNCYDEPEAVHALLNKCAEFITAYIRAFRDAGADGVVMAEPAAGLLSPAIMEEFSCEYVKRIVAAVQDKNFIVIYHNCGNSVSRAPEIIADMGAKGYHFGNAVNMREMLDKMPRDVLVMGNLDPAGIIRGGDPDTVRSETMKILEECGKYPNFVISSGCDIPPAAPWANIDAFFGAVSDFYGA